MFETINRTALIITPKQPVIDWQNKIFPDSPITNHLEDKNDNGNVFLIPQFDDPDGYMDYIKRNFKEIFHYQLWEWCIDKKLFPKVLTWKMFNEWFDWSIQTMILDLVDEDIEKEEF